MVARTRVRSKYERIKTRCLDRFGLPGNAETIPQLGYRWCRAWELGCAIGIEVVVHVNDSPFLFQGASDPGYLSGLNSDTFLGDLAVGDTIYLAFGPNGNDGRDGFLQSAK